jgi:hypothetical protein|tara:strand:- start:130 stop:252 length:123 start_codon:yes stop_codon:yes gene_type:complete
VKKIRWDKIFIGEFRGVKYFLAEISGVYLSNSKIPPPSHE